MTKPSPIGILLIAYLLLAGAYSVINPIHEGTDELRHYRFVRYIIENGRLPVQGQEACRSQSHHPPLIYALGALATSWVDTGKELCAPPASNPFWGYRYWEVGTDNKNMYLHDPAVEGFPWRGEALAAHIVRFINVLVGLGAVWFTYLAAREIWPRPSWTPLGVAALLAFNPMFLYMAGTINNDVIAALSGALILYLLLRLLHDEQGLRWRWGIWLGLAYVLALMSKFNLAPILLLISAALTLVAWRKRQWGWWWELHLLIGLITLYGAGWWFGRNLYLYGEPTGFETLTELWGVRTPAESVGLVIQELPHAWSSLWGRFGYGQIPLPREVYAVLWWLVLASGSGIAVHWLFGLWEQRVTGQRPTADQLPLPSQQGLWLAAAQVGLFAAVLLAYMLVSPAGAMGRFFFPGLPALVLLVPFGLGRWLSLFVPGQGKTAVALHKALAALLGGGMVFLGVFALTNYLAPAYARPQAWPAQALAAVANPVHIQFEEFIRLHGYEIEPTTTQPGAPLTVRLYWEVLNQPPGDYYFFLHVRDETGTMVAQRDTHPGMGKFPASQWRPGDKFVETVQVYLPETAYPEPVTLQIGFYAPVEQYRLAVYEGACVHFLGDVFTLGEVTVVAKRGRYPNPQDVNYNRIVRLVGYEYVGGRVAAPGETVQLTLYWEGLDGQRLPQTMAQLYVTAPDGRVIAQTESPLLDYRRAPAVFADTHTLVVAADAPPGEYQVSLYLFDIFTQSLSMIVAEDGHEIDNHLQLARLLIR